MKKLSIAIIFVLFSINLTFAQSPTIGDFIRAHDESDEFRERLETRVMDVSLGLMFANVHLKKKGRSPTLLPSNRPRHHPRSILRHFL